MTSGIVKHFDPATGRGIILTDDGGQDISVHQLDINIARLGQLATGQRLSFDIQPWKTTLKATNLWATFGNR